MTEKEAEALVFELSEKLRKYQYQYYVKGRPELSDLKYDELFDQLKSLEQQFPSLLKEDSPTVRVGSDLSSDLPEMDHTIPVLSLDKAYTLESLIDWVNKSIKNTGSSLSFFMEEKIDGVSIVLYYEKGLLKRALTRGNGYRGNDVTANIKTIGAVPLRLSREIDIAVRGEIFLPKSRFEEINSKLETPYANPRNLAAGTIRRIKSSSVADVPLDIFVYEGFFQKEISSHREVLDELEELGFKLNPRRGFFSENKEDLKSLEGSGVFTAELSSLEDFIKKETEERSSLEYEIDGLVFKVNELEAREKLGYTGHHPRWAIAYKFDAPEGETVIKDIDVQIGRTGRITPVARVVPVQIGGSEISNVTLHNNEYIKALELAPGDRVAVSKRGDVIPAVERLLEKGDDSLPVWKFPETCPSCSSRLEIIGAHHFCVNKNCPEQIKGKIKFFTAKDQMDIQNLGNETVEVLIKMGMVKDVADIYTCPFSRLMFLPGFGDKKISLIEKGVEDSKKRPFRVVLRSLGIPEVGQKASELLIESGFNSAERLFELADNNDTEKLAAIPGIGEKTAGTIIREFSDPELRKLIGKLKDAGLNLYEEVKIKPEGEKGVFEGQTWCVTGSFENFKPRSKAEEIIKENGGKLVSQVSGKTSHLLAGENAGSKLEKAEKFGTKIISEEEFLKLI